MNKRSVFSWKQLLSTAFVFVALFGIRHSALAVARTWDGGGSDGTCGGNPGDGNKWSCAANWSSDTTPTSSDTVTFDSTSTKNGTIDASFQGTVTGMTIAATYSGTITQARALTVSGAYSQSAGTFTGSGDAMSVTSFTLAGGTFTAPSATLTDSGAWTHTAGGTFAANGGTVAFTGSGATYNDTQSPTFNSVTINKTSAGILTITTGQTLTVPGTLTLTDGAIGTGTIESTGTLSIATTFDGGTGTLLISGSGTNPFTLPNGTSLPRTTLNNANVTVTGNASGTVTFANTLTLTAGTINAGAGQITITTGGITVNGGTFVGGAGTLLVSATGLTISSGSFTAPSGTFNLTGGFTHTAGGTFAHNSGTISFGTGTYNVTQADTFNNVTIAGTLTVTTGQTLAVPGTFTFTSGSIATGTVSSQGAVSLATGLSGGTGTLLFDGSASNTITLPTSGTLPGTTINNANATITGNASGTVTFQTALVLTAGTFNGGAGNITVTAGGLTISGGAFTAPSGTLTLTAGGWTHTAGGTFTHNSGTVSFGGVGTINASPAETFYSLTKTSTSALTVTTGQTHVVAGTLTLTDGTLVTGTLDAQGDVSLASTFDGGTGTVTVTGSATRSITLPNGGSFPKFTWNAANVTVTGNSSGTVTFANTMTLTAGTINAGAGQISISTGGITVNGGTFVGGAGTLTVGATGLTISSGSFTAPSGTFFLTGGFTHTAGGTFAHNSGTISFGAGTYNVTQSDTFNNVTVAGTLTVTTGQTLAVPGTFTFTSGSIVTGTVSSQGAVSLATGLSGGTGTLLFDGSASNTITLPTSGTLPNVTVTNANATITGNASGTCTMGNLSFQAGTFNGGAGNLTVSNFTLSGGTFTAPSATMTVSGNSTSWGHTAGGTFNTNNGTVTFTGSGSTLNASPAESFYNLIINKTTAQVLTVTSGQTHYVTGTLTLTDGTIGTGTIEAQGDVSLATTFDGGTAGGAVNITGNATRTITLPTSGSWPIFTVNAPNLTITGNASGTVTLGTLSFQAGTFNGGAGSVNMTNFTQSGGTFTAPSGTITLTNGGWTHTAGGTFAHNNGTVVFSTAGTLNASPAETFYGLSKTNSAALTVTTGQTHVVAGTLTLTDGTLVTGTLDAQGDISLASTFDGGTGLVTVTGNATRSITLPNGGSFPQFTWSAPNVTVTGNASGTVIFANAMSWSAGTFNGGAGSVTITTGGFTLSGGSFTAPSGTFTLTSGSWTHTAGGTFIHNSGTVSFTSSSTSTINASPNETFGSLTLSKNSSSTSTVVTTGQTHVVTGTLNLAGGKLDTGTLDAQGGVTLSSSYGGGTGLVTVTGNAVRAITLSNGGSFPQFTWNAPNATVTGNSSGTVTFANAMVWSDGTFNGGAGSITVTTGGFTLSGGSFTAPSGTFTLPAGAWTHTGGGTFAHNNGTVVMSSTASNVSLASDETLYNLTLSKVITVTTGKSLAVAGLLALSSGAGINTGTLEAQGTITMATGQNGGTGTLKITGPATLTLPTSGTIAAFVIDNASAVITGNASGTPTVTALTINNGTFTGGAGSLNITNAFTLAGGTFTGPTGTLTIYGAWIHTAGTYNHNSSRVRFFGVNQSIGASETFYALQKRAGSSSDIFTFPTTGTVTVLHDISLTGYSQSNSATRFYLTVKSDTDGVAASVDFQGHALVSETTVQDLNNIGADAAECPVGCTDAGNNTNWDFHKTVVVSEPTGDTDESGTTATFTVVLSHRPSASVTVGVLSSDETEGTVSPSSITFTTGNWDTPRTVTVTGVDDATDDGAVDYTVTVGPAASSDTNYSGVSPARTPTFTNTDNDTTALSFDFDEEDVYTFENVKDSGSGTIAWFAYDGTHNWGNLMTGSSGSNVDISSSKIKAGCQATIAGTEYDIVKVQDAATGKIVIQEPGVDPVDFMTSMASGSVTAISCNGGTGSSIGLNREFIVTASVSGVPGANSLKMTYDPTRQSAWVPDNSSCAISRVNLSSLTITGSFVTTSGSPCNPTDAAYDPNEDAVWVFNANGTYGLVKLNASTGGYYNGTVAASALTRNGGGRIGLVYDDERDVVWTSTWSPYTVISVDPATLSVLTTATTNMTFQNGTALDTEHDVVWGFSRVGSNFGPTNVMKIDATTGALANVTAIDSQYLVPGFEDALEDVVYDSANDALWVLDTSCNSFNNSGRVSKMDVITGEILAVITVGLCPTELVVDAASNRLYVSNTNGASMTEINTMTAVVVATHTVGYAPSATLMTSDFDNDLWNHETYGDSLDRIVVDGAAADQYYTVTTGSGSQLSASTWSGVETATVTDAVDGQSAFYSFSFDSRNSYKVFTGGAWRTIASNKAVDHGGTDGVWYYRNNASTWSAASTDEGPAAVSQAIAAGSNNQLTSADVNAMVSADWTASNGSTNLSTLDMAATLYTNDAHDNPTVGNATFAFSTRAVTTSRNQTRVYSAPYVAPVAFIPPLPAFTLPSLGSILNGLLGGAPRPPVSGGSSRPTPPPRLSFWPAAKVSGTTAKFVGTEIRGKSSASVYYVDPAVGKRRPYMDAQTYFTYNQTFGAVDSASSNDLADIPLGPPMLPNPGSVLVKIPSDPKVYVTEPDKEDPTRLVLRPIPDEDTAKSVYGEKWADHVIDVPMTLFEQTDVAAPIDGSYAADASRLLRRIDLHE